MESDESELVRALKQMIELRSSSTTAKPTTPEVTLFGHKISQQVDESTVGLSFKKPCPAAESIEKLVASRANANLKQLYKEHLKKKRVRAANADSSEVACASGSPEILTLPLLSMLDKCQNEQRPGLKRQKTEANDPDKRELTIFYKGTVYVYEDVPLDKAKAMMVVAESASSRSAHYLATQKPVEADPSACKSYAAVLDLPQARKASLQRFLERRKARWFRFAPSEKSTSSPSPHDACGSTFLETRAVV